MNRELLASIEALLPTVAEAASEAERLRRPVDAVMEQLCETGVFRAFVPRRFGGLELDLETFVRIGMRLGEACTSTAWVTTFCMEHNWLFAHFEPEAQQEVWGRQPWFLAPGTLSPNGHAEAVEGGFRLRGRWQWGTGVMHADWVLLTGMVRPDEGAPPGPPDMRMFMLPRDAVTVEDTWHVDGMVATGSNDIVVDGAFVEARYAQRIGPMGMGRSVGSEWHASPVFRLPMLPFKCITAASPAVGAARRAVDLFRERAQSRTIMGSTQQQQDLTAAQMRLGNLEVRVQMAEMLMVQTALDLESLGEREAVTTAEERARLRLHCAHIVNQCRDIVRDAVEGSGASAHFLDHPLQRIHRDIHTLACHTVFDRDLGSEVYGQTLLGLTPSRPI